MIDRLKQILAKPVWQGVGALLTFIFGLFALAVPLYYSGANRVLTINDVFRYVHFLRPDAEDIKYSVSGESSNWMIWQGYEIRYSGRDPLLPSDFYRPLTVQAEAPLRVVSVETLHSKVEPSWEKVAPGKFSLKPTLLNPGDSFTAVVYLVREDSLELSSRVKDHTSRMRVSHEIYDKVDTIWEGRISGVEDLTRKANRRSGLWAKISIQTPLSWIDFSNEGVWIFLALIVIMIFTTSLLIARFQSFNDNPIRVLCLILSGIILSFMTAEVLASVRDLGFRIAWFCYPILALHGILVYIIVRSARRPNQAL